MQMQMYADVWIVSMMVYHVIYQMDLLYITRSTP